MVVWIVFKHPEIQLILVIMVHYEPSPLSVIHDSPKDDDKHGDAVDPDVELPGGGADRLKLG